MMAALRIRHGFSLTEVMVALGVFGAVVGAVVPAVIMCQRSWVMTSVQLQAAQRSSAALERLVYGVGLQYGLRSAVSTTVVFTAGTDWRVAYRDVVGNSNSFRYISANRQLVYYGLTATGGSVVGDCIATATASNTAHGLWLSVTADAQEGRFSWTNTMTTFISYRNN